MRDDINLGELIGLLRGRHRESLTPLQGTALARSMLCLGFFMCMVFLGILKLLVE